MEAIKNFLATKKEKIILSALIFLIALLFFQLGFIYGARFFEPCEIKIYKNEK